MRLIDADALKKALDEQMNFEENCRDSVFDIIDNAPTVESTFKPIAEVKFDKEQLQEIVDNAKAEVLASIERPQGEWVKNETRPNECQCDNCGNYDLSCFPFCHWCGADMRGDINGERNAN